MLDKERAGRGLARAVAIVAMVFGCQAARAVTIIDLTTHTVLFQDNFESGTTPSTPAVGTWSIFGPDSTVTNAASPGPAQGNDYLQLFRDSGEFGQGTVQASFAAPAATDVILLQMMVYLPSTTDTDARGQFILDDGDFNSARAWARPDGSGNVDAIGTGFSIIPTGLTYSTDTWQEWDLQYNGNGTFNVTVNGVTASSSFSSVTTGAIQFADLFNGAPNPAGSLFLDGLPTRVSGTPEPAPAYLLGGALAGLVVLRRLGRR